LEKAIASKERQLRDETFLSRAPEKIVNGLKMAVEQQRVELGKLVERRRELEGDR
jgi:valyl-tRNA synthetase